MKDKIIELLDNDEFDFALDLVKGANDGKLYDSLIEETSMSDGFLLKPECNQSQITEFINSFFEKLNITPDLNSILLLILIIFFHSIQLNRMQLA